MHPRRGSIVGYSILLIKTINCHLIKEAFPVPLVIIYLPPPERCTAFFMQHKSLWQQPGWKLPLFWTGYRQEETRARKRPCRLCCALAADNFTKHSRWRKTSTTEFEMSADCNHLPLFWCCSHTQIMKFMVVKVWLQEICRGLEETVANDRLKRDV